MMNRNDEEARDVATRWTDALSKRDVEGLLALYHPEIGLERVERADRPIPVRFCQWMTDLMAADS